jgi:CHAT domain-containing protein
MVLAVGGVRYGPDPGKGHRYLPGSEEELRQVLRLAGPRAKEGLKGSDATIAGLSRRRASKVRYLHLATHGFYNIKDAVAEEDRINANLRRLEVGADQRATEVGLAARNPLGFTGIVLADANVPEKRAQSILTGEAIAVLPLQGCELVVLSACSAGVGVQMRDEGMAGLPRAFHLAGARQVVSAVWGVPDVTTLVLMEEFYARLWDNKNPLSAPEALRQAQLAVWRNPDKVHKRMQELKKSLALRGFDVEMPALPGGGKVVKAKHSPALWWAGFVLSGAALPPNE